MGDLASAKARCRAAPIADSFLTLPCCGHLQVADLQTNLKQEQIIVEEKKTKTQALIETIGQEKAVVDQAVEAGREDEEAAAKLQVRHSCNCLPCRQLQLRYRLHLFIVQFVKTAAQLHSRMIAAQLGDAGVSGTASQASDAANACVAADMTSSQLVILVTRQTDMPPTEHYVTLPYAG